MLIGLVGPCGAGKSSLASILKSDGLHVRHIAQEHSYVPDMWKRLTNPDLLIYLEVSYENTVKRRRLDWTYQEYAEQLRRLQHAHQHADLIIDTNPINLQEVRLLVLSFVNSQS